VSEPTFVPSTRRRTDGPNDDPRVEGHIRRILSTYPWRYRLEHGEEIVATTLDTVPASAHRLPLSTAIDLLRGGQRVRRQHQPPLTTRLAYRFGARIHPQWLRWVYDDVEDPGYVARARRDLLLIVLASIPLLAVVGDPRDAIAAAIVGLIGALVVGFPRFAVERNRAKIRVRHGLLPGVVDPSRAWVRTHRRPVVPDVDAARALAVAGLPAVVLGAAALWALESPHRIAMSRPDLTLRAPVAPEAVLPELAPWFVGGALAALLLGVAGWAKTRRRSDVAPAAPSSAAPALSLPFLIGVLTAATAVGAAAVVLLWLTWWSWKVGLVLAVAAGLGAVSVVAGLALALARRGTRPGIWSVLPWLGPGETVLCVSLRVAESYPVEDRWVVGGPAQRA
jgi:hypothetical protein